MLLNLVKYLADKWYCVSIKYNIPTAICSRDENALRKWKNIYEEKLSSWKKTQF